MALHRICAQPFQSPEAKSDSPESSDEENSSSVISSPDIHVTQSHESYDGSQSGGSEYDSADELGDVEGNTCSLKYTLHGCRKMISTGGYEGNPYI